MSKSKIEWTERTWNPVTGCSKVSAGCKNCYAEGIANRFWGARKFADIMLHEERLQEPIKRKQPTMYFVTSMSDLFHEEIPVHFIESVFEIMTYCKHHTFQVLTKRPKRMMYVVNEWVQKFGSMDNVWFGISAEDQKTYDDRIPFLLDTNCSNLFLSLEPLLGEIDLRIRTLQQLFDRLPRWIIIGCESGPKRREFESDWVHDIIWQCSHYLMKIFVKQIIVNNKVEKDVNNFPIGLQIREYPNEMES